MAADLESQRRGRPSLQGERRTQIISAFIELVAKKGLEHTSLADVAEASGLHLSALRHFVGNRDELIHAAIIDITNKYIGDPRVSLPPLKVINMLFDMNRDQSFATEHRAWVGLLPEAVRTPEGRAVVKTSYVQLMTLVGDALRQQYPNASRARVADTACAIACLVESDFMIQLLGYPRARSKGMRDAALALVARFD